MLDWFGDLNDWLPEYFFSKLVRECYEQTVKAYIEAIFKRKKSFADTSRAAQHLVNDRIRILELFGEGDYHERLFAAGLREEGCVEKQLSVLTNVSKVLLAPYVYDCKAEITELLIEFGAVGKDAVFGIVAMRKGNTKESLKEWKSVVAGLQEGIGGRANEVNSKFDLPFRIKDEVKAMASEGVGGEEGVGGLNPFGSNSNPFGSSNGVDMATNMREGLMNMKSKMTMTPAKKK